MINAMFISSFPFVSVIICILCQTQKETPGLAKGAANAVFDLYDVVTHELLSSDLR